MADIDIGRAPANHIVLPFFGTGALFYLILSILLLFSGGDWSGHYFTPHFLALVHTAALGWGSMVISWASLYFSQPSRYVKAYYRRCSSSGWRYGLVWLRLFFIR